MPSSEAHAQLVALPKKQWVVKAYVTLVLVVNLVLLWLAWEDKSWNAFAISIAVGPISNGVLVLLGLVGPSFRKRMGWRTTMFLGLPMELLPVLAIGLDFWAIMNMGLSGC